MNSGEGRWRLGGIAEEVLMDPEAFQRCLDQVASVVSETSDNPRGELTGLDLVPAQELRYPDHFGRVRLWHD